MENVSFSEGTLLPCADYEIHVLARANTIFGESSPAYTTTKDVKPGRATKLQIVETFKDGFTATWCPPNINPQCAATWEHTTIENYWGNMKYVGDCQSLKVALLQCGTNYKFTVVPYSPTGIMGDGETTVTATKPC